MITAGQRFGKLTVIRVFDSKRVLTVCDCGTLKMVAEYLLLRGQVQSCGCVRVFAETSPLTIRKRQLMGNYSYSQYVNPTGLRFGKLTVIGRTSNSKVRGKYMWLCKCDCGGEIIVLKSQLFSGEVFKCENCE